MDREKGGVTVKQKETKIRRVSSSGTLRPSRRHPGTLASPSESSGDLCVRLIMWGAQRSSRGVHLFCVDYPSAAKLSSIYRPERDEIKTKLGGRRSSSGVSVHFPLLEKS